MQTTEKKIGDDFLKSFIDVRRVKALGFPAGVCQRKPVTSLHKANQELNMLSSDATARAMQN